MIFSITSRILLVLQCATAFAPLLSNQRLQQLQLDAAKIGIFFGTSTGSTETVADLIKEEIGDDDADGPFDIETLEGSVASNFEKYNALIVGTPTWNTGADMERSGTGWDELYYNSMQELKLQGKKVAVFGLGDQESYAENYADATGELHDVFEKLGCQMMGYTSQEGYEHEDSKAIRGDLFCGLLCDMVNQEDLTEQRVTNWITQLKSEGFFDGGDAAAVNGASATAAAPAVVEQPATVEVLSELEENSNLLDDTIAAHANVNGYTPHYNPKKGSTMWVSADGRNCYYTVDSASTSVSVP